MTTTPDTGGPANARREPRLSAFFSPITDPGLDPDHPDRRELEDDLEREQDELRHEMVLGQRSGRCVIASVSALIGWTARSTSVSETALLVGVCLLYIALVFALPAFFALSAPGRLRSARWLPPAVVTTDLLVVGAIFAITHPQHGYMFLLIAPLLVWMAGFYFSWTLATYAAIVSAAMYLAIARHGGPDARVPLSAVAANLAAFAIIVVVLIVELSRYRERVDELRLFCRLVGEGDVGLRLPFKPNAAADDLTSLGHSLDSMRKRLVEQIGVDVLTGCLNRRALESRLRGEWRLAKRRAGTIGILAIDLDHFKAVNDVNGHAVGDTVLQQLAGIMRNLARESDVVSRLGGDEFIMVLPDTDRAGAQVVAERLRHRVADFAFGSRDNPLRVTISVGVAVARGQDSISTVEILAEADRALYASKQAGRNQVSMGR